MVHLARHSNGWAPLERFLDSYAAHPAGIDHALLVAVKGLPGSEVLREYEQRVAARYGTVLPLQDVGFDVGSYWTAAREVSASSFCFLNSFSRILDDGWLAKLAHHQGPSVGIVGATGSWESPSSNRDRQIRDVVLLAPWKRPPPDFPQRRLTARDRGWLLKEWWAKRQENREEWPPFPNPHIRTNAFLARRDLLLDINVGALDEKQDAWHLESGWDSLTRQVIARGLSVLVAGRDGLAYPPDAWPESHTFRSGNQANLLVADNRTDQWMRESAAGRAALTLAAWGRGAC